MFRFLTSGESHGKMLSAIIEGLPSGLEILESDINVDLKRRQNGYGRGARCQSIEKDKVELIAGIRWGKTTGAPIGLLIKNLDWENRKKEMSVYPEDADENDVITKPRPGHADLVGMIKYGLNDAKPILERASARNTATLVAVGAICKKFLKEFGVDISGYVKAIGNVETNAKNRDLKISKKMIEAIDNAKKKGDTLGGKIEICISGVVAGIGSHIQYDKRLDSGLAQIMMGIPSVKNVCIGEEDVFMKLGSLAHDEIFYSKQNGFYHKTNHAGGIEGGMSNGEEILITISLKPIPTLLKPLNSVDVLSKKSAHAEIVRSDVAVADSAVVVAEAMAGIKLTEFYLEKFGGDSMTEIKRNFEGYKKHVK